MNRLSAILVPVLLLVVSLGCDQSGSVPLGTVKGQVTLDGKPMPNVSVTFIPAGEQGGATSMGRTDASGNYELIYVDGKKGALIGKHKVSVTTVRDDPAAAAQMSSDSPEYAQQASGASGDYSKQWVDPIPAKYNSPTTLEHEVKSGSNTINLELKSS
jgi:hypothetical protein